MAALGLLSSVAAPPINGTGFVTPDVIFGDGNDNGSFSRFSSLAVELELRGKLRYDLAQLPENTFGYDSDHTYTFSPAQSNALTGLSAFNFECSIGVDPAGLNADIANSLGEWTHRLDIDYHPPTLADSLSFDPINLPCADHAIGNNSTGNGGGSEADCFSGSEPDDYQSLIGSNNVA